MARSVWCRAPAIPASFPFEAVGAVIRRDALEPLAGLVDKSLIVTSDDGETSRYRLFQPEGQYGLGRLVEAGEEDLAGRCHRDTASVPSPDGKAS